MHKIILTLAVLFFITEGVAKEMKVLMIGNSFSICVGKNLPQIVKAGKKHQLVLTSAYIGGCSLETHAKNLKQIQNGIIHLYIRIACAEIIENGIDFKETDKNRCAKYQNQNQTKGR